MVLEYRALLLERCPLVFGTFNHCKGVCVCAGGWQEMKSTHTHPPEPNCEFFSFFFFHLLLPKQMLLPHLKYAVMVINEIAFHALKLVLVFSDPVVIKAWTFRPRTPLVNPQRNTSLSQRSGSGMPPKHTPAPRDHCQKSRGMTGMLSLWNFCDSCSMLDY